MRRRLLLLTCFTGSLLACASLLGDFEVDPPGFGNDASTQNDGNVSSSGNVGEGGLTDATDGDTGTDGAAPDTKPVGLQVATSLSATCATVQYPSQRQVTYCWGAEGAGVAHPDATLGKAPGDTGVDGFFRPRTAAGPNRYVTMASMMGAGSGAWFAGKGTDGQTTGTYAWGANDNGETAAGSPSETLPYTMKLGINLLSFETLYAAANHGCLVTGKKLHCWGSNTNCEIRSGASLANACNTELPALAATGNSSRVVEDESSFPSGKTGAVARMAGGNDHSCVHVESGSGVNPDDDVRCWGSNLFRQAKDANENFVDEPTTIVTVKRQSAELAAGESHTCAITDTSKLSCWGRNDARQANPETTVSPASPTNVQIPGQLSLLRAAGAMSCVVAKVGNQPSRVWCWGNGPNGRLPAEVTANIAKVAGIQDVTQLALGREHACAVAKKEGASAADKARVWCWGASNTAKRVNPRGAVADQYQQPIEIQFPPEPQ